MIPPAEGEQPPLPVHDCALVTTFRPCPSGGLCTPLPGDMQRQRQSVNAALRYPLAQEMISLRSLSATASLDLRCLQRSITPYSRAPKRYLLLEFPNKMDRI